MDEKELRLECLRLAEKSTGQKMAAKLIVSEAALFYQFLQNGQAPDQAQPHKDAQEKSGHQDAD